MRNPTNNALPEDARTELRRLVAVNGEATALSMLGLSRQTLGMRLPRSRRHRGYAAIFVVAASLMNFNSNSIGLT